MLKAIDDWMFGDFRANRQRTEERHTMDMKRMQALLESEAGQTLMNKARAAALDRGEGYYGGRGVDPYVKGSEDLGKIRAARDKFSEDEMSLDTAAYFEAAEKSVLDRMKQVPADNRAREFVGPPAPDNREYFAPQDEVEMFETLMGEKKGKSRDTIISPKQRKPTDLELQGMLSAQDRRPLADYFQAPTETVPEGNIPKTYPQMGITNIDDQATLEEMQKALPSVDMRTEYEADPEMMKKLMELWRAKKLTKQNLHKAFSMIQQTAQQSLGIR